MATRKGRRDGEAVYVARGQQLERVIWPGGGPRPLNPRELHLAIEETISRWLEAACLWPEPLIGDHRVLVFEVEVQPGTRLRVQFSADPMEWALCEVSSGRRGPGVRPALAAGGVKYLEESGFAIDDEGENYQRDVRIDEPADVAPAARDVVDILYQVFGYEGMQPLHAKLTHGTRSRTGDVFDGFTPQDVAKAFLLCGYQAADITDDDTGPVIHCRKGGIATVVFLGDRLDENDAYEGIAFHADFDLTGADAEEVTRKLGPPREGQIPVVSLSINYHVGGGVTLTWLLMRIREWDAVTREQHRRTRRSRRRRRARPKTVRGETVH